MPIFIFFPRQYTFSRGMGKNAFPMALLNSLACLRFPPASINLWWSSLRVSRERSGLRPRVLRGTLSSVFLMVHHRQQ